MTAVVLAHPASSLRPEAVPAACRLAVRGLDVFYGTSQALKGISLEIPARQVTAIIGPSGCGKSTLLRVFNRIHELQPGCRASGQVLLDGEDILSPRYPLNHLRSRVGMVFQKPVPFPMSIFENIAWGIRHHERPGRAVLAERVEEALRRAALWDEVKDRLGRSALALSGGQQQRLCIARSIALRPEVLLLDEPTSALDPVATARIEQLIEELKTDYTLVMVTHNMQQAARISDRTAFLYMGELIEAGATRTLFNRPAQRQTADYIAGRFG